MVFNTRLLSKNINWQMLSILLFLFTLLNITIAQTSTIKSRVLDKTTEEALFGANIIIQGTSLGAASDLDGRFIIRNVPLGNQKMVISYIGYNAISVDIVVKENNESIDYFIEPTTLEGETVVITAQAEGQLSAINQQLTSNTIANIVSKDRIKELPDVNAAETIGRLPGVSIQRYGGEATKIEIRGLNPKYSLITVNGVEVPSTGTEDRSVDLSLISSNMLDGIILKKSNTPDMDADVLGGTVDLRLKEAPPKLQLNLSAQGGYNKLQDYYGNYNFTASVSDRFFDNLLGVIVNANIDNYNRSADKLQDDWRKYNNTISSVDLILREEQLNRKRTGVSFLLDYLIPEGKVIASVFFNQLNSEGLNHIDQVNTDQLGYSTNQHIYQLEQYKSKTNVFTSSLGINQDFDWIRYDASLNRSGTVNSNPDRRFAEFIQGSSALDSGYPIDVPPSELVKYYNIDTIQTNLSALYSYGQRTIENTTSARLNFELPFRLDDQLSGYIKTGAKMRWIDRSNDQSQYGRGGLQYGSGQSNAQFLYVDKIYPEWGILANVNEYQLLNILPFLSNYTRSNFLNGDFQLGLVPNETMMHQFSDALMLAPDSLRRLLWQPYSVGNFGYDYKGFERYEAAYLMSEFDLGTFLTFIPGVRWEQDFSNYEGQSYRVVESGAGIGGPPAEFVRLNKIRKNKFWLPMISLILRPTDWLQLRLAGTKTLARPDYMRYAPISYISSDSKFVWAANYSLKPSQSTNFDIGVSVFNNEIGLFSVNAFYKKIQDLVFFSSFSYRPGITVDPALEIPATWLESIPTIFANRNNPDPAKYSGFEIEWQTRFWYLPSVFSGLVLNINYTHIYSEMKLAYDSLVTQQVGTRRIYSIKQTSFKTRMPDQPAHILNITVGYDFDDFSARLSYLYQTDKLIGIAYEGTYPSSRLSSYVGGYGRLDLTLQQKFFQTLQVFANFNNLNNRHDQNFIGSELNHPSYIEYYGFSMDLGIRYNL